MSDFALLPGAVTDAGGGASGAVTPDGTPRPDAVSRLDGAPGTHGAIRTDEVLHYGSPSREQRALEEGRGVADLTGSDDEPALSTLGASGTAGVSASAGAGVHDDPALAAVGLTRAAADRLGVTFFALGRVAPAKSPDAPGGLSELGKPDARDELDAADELDAGDEVDAADEPDALGVAFLQRTLVQSGSPAALAARLEETGLVPVGSLAWRAERLRRGLVALDPLPRGVTARTHAFRLLFLEGPDAADLPDVGETVFVARNSAGADPREAAPAGAREDAAGSHTAAPVGVILEAVRDWEDGPVALAAIRKDADVRAIVAAGVFRAYQDDYQDNYRTVGRACSHGDRDCGTNHQQEVNGA